MFSCPSLSPLISSHACPFMLRILVGSFMVQLSPSSESVFLLSHQGPPPTYISSSLLSHISGRLQPLAPPWSTKGSVSFRAPLQTSQDPGSCRSNFQHPQGLSPPGSPLPKERQKEQVVQAVMLAPWLSSKGRPEGRRRENNPLSHEHSETRKFSTNC